MIGDGTHGHPPDDCRRNASTAAPQLEPSPDVLRSPAPPNTVATGIYVAHAPSVHGPWEVIPVTRPNSSHSSDLCSGWVNPSPHVAPDGSITLAFQSSRCELYPIGKHYVALIGIARAATWRGPYTLLSPQAVKPEQPLCPAGQAEVPLHFRPMPG